MAVHVNSLNPLTMKFSETITRFRSHVSALLAAVLLLGTAAFIPSEIEIQVSPNVLNLLNKGEWVTIHADIPYSQVYQPKTTVTLNEVPVAVTFADNQGNLVAKFIIGSIKALDLKVGQLNELVLEGVDINGNTFTGTQEVMVIRKGVR